MSFSRFHPIVQQWFTTTLGQPTATQLRGWDAIRDGHHTLIAAPTGSGKTLAAFLTALDELTREAIANPLAPLSDEVRVVYVSPLKALSADIHKNLAEPRAAIARLAESQGAAIPRITAAVRTGDTTAGERAAMIRTPPHILVTTPESLYLLLTSDRSRQMLATARTVIVDEIHAVIGTRRGAHLALSLERLEHVAGRRLQRIGLSATQKPIEEVGRYLVGTTGDRCTIVDAGHRRAMDIGIELPRSPLEAVTANEVWEEYYDRLAALITAHKTTIVFVNTRRMAERAARHLSDRLGEDAVTAHHGSLSKETRLGGGARLKNGQLRALVATASLELGIDIGHVDLVCQIGSPHRIATLLQRVGRSGHSIDGHPKGRVFPTSRDDLIECAALLRSIGRGELDAIVSHDRPLDVLAQQIVAEAACEPRGEDDLYTLAARAWPYRALPRGDFDAVLKMSAEGFSTRRGRRAALVHRDEVNRTLRGRRGSRLLAQTSGGAIPEIADFRVILDPEDTPIGTLNEDFAIESNAGDVFQLGNASWRILQVTSGTVRVADAHGAPPNIPFWLGEAPARSDELSRAVSDLRAEIDARLDQGLAAAESWLTAETGLGTEAAQQAIAYLNDGRRVLGAIPSQRTLVLERFFDESGGMQLVLHAPFGSRVTKAWGLALRKRFCRQFNFELQAAATEDGLMLSLGPQHSFPLSDVFRYLHPETTRDVLVQALLDAPVFETRWRWNATLSLAVPRNRGARKVAPQVQRMLAADLLASVFPDAAACLENIPGDREVPDHPLVNQTIRDCLEEAMDLEALNGVLGQIHRGELTLVARDTPEPSVFAHEILGARPYAFLDDAPLEERRSHAVQTRRPSDASSDNLGTLDPAAIERVREEVRPDPRDADELHDTLLTIGMLLESDLDPAAREFLPTLAAAGRACRVRQGDWTAIVAAERLPEVLALHPDAILDPPITAPPTRAIAWDRGAALTELVRGRACIAGPATAAAFAAALGVDEAAVDHALLALEADGAVLRGRFTPGVASECAGDSVPRLGPSGGSGDSVPRPILEWCDRALLSRIHRYTLNRLRAEIEPVSPADFMRFLFKWQHLDQADRLAGLDGLREALGALDGFELPAAAWERAVLPGRITDYAPSMLDMLCLTGEIAWARLSPRSAESTDAARLTPATPIALFAREHAGAWQRLQPASDDALDGITPHARAVLECLRERGPSFFQDLRQRTGLDVEETRLALGSLVATGLAASDGFSGLRALHAPIAGQPTVHVRGANFAGRWSALRAPVGFGLQAPGSGENTERTEDVEMQAWAFLRRYGVVFRRLLTREVTAAPWRELARVYRRLEARGEIRGGRFVSGMSGEQFALPRAVERLREVRRSRPDDKVVVVGTADPLNLAGIVTAGDRVRAAARNRIAYRNGVPVAVMEGNVVRPCAEFEADVAEQVSRALNRRSAAAHAS
jgi:ATP-dependent Lhr-like helicase